MHHGPKGWAERGPSSAVSGEGVRRWDWMVEEKSRSCFQQFLLLYRFPTASHHRAAEQPRYCQENVPSCWCTSLVLVEMALKAVALSQGRLRKHLLLHSTALLRHSSKFLYRMSPYAHSKYHQRLMTICLQRGSNAWATELLETVLWLQQGGQLVPLVMAGFVTWTTIHWELNWDKAPDG